ncbi:hypothetical protein BLNAU_23309 [Blattamonas nauphoetae]|uniref:Uncharacterized protein n=1 Tax=Blattamonas nauphoetae TaxID=2049346 RepID=A0ABQ9WTN9_9EUKA|nr:hypothetical protein BLNAU_23309 [Blattamonas nauphoetae]
MPLRGSSLPRPCESLRRRAPVPPQAQPKPSEDLMWTGGGIMTSNAPYVAGHNNNSPQRVIGSPTKLVLGVFSLECQPTGWLTLSSWSKRKVK